jgi:hypothetical protein
MGRNNHPSAGCVVRCEICGLPIGGRLVIASCDCGCGEVVMCCVGCVSVLTGSGPADAEA